MGCVMWCENVSQHTVYTFTEGGEHFRSTLKTLHQLVMNEVHSFSQQHEQPQFLLICEKSNFLYQCNGYRNLPSTTIVNVTGQINHVSDNEDETTPAKTLQIATCISETLKYLC